MSLELVSKKGIPNMDVITDVESFLKTEKMSVDEAIKVMDERYKKYKYTENSMQQQKARLSEKLPEFASSLALLEVLIEKKEKGESFETTYQIADEVYTRAIVDKPDKVSIWLGANVMVEYELDKAKEMLVKNRDTVQLNVDELSSELAFVKDQVTTTEVNMAHLYNAGVKKRQQAAATAGGITA